MSQSEISRFVADMKTNTKLQEEARNIAPGVDSMVALASRHGYSFGATDVQSYVKSQPDVELTEEQLASVSGGAVNRTWIWGTDDSGFWIISHG